MQAFEKLGMFYLGREYDLKARQLEDDPLLYDAKDLTTHAVCVGMTGSGKTGLCIGLLEEAAIDNIPSIVIDPKGDIANLLLTFPDLSAASFRPWINEEDARKKNMSPDDYAQAQADLWRKGIAQWGQGPERIQMLRDKVDMAIYTPGSNAGLPVSILSSFAAPTGDALDDSELLQERISTTATCVLSLLGIDADPIRSREHILIANILNHSWQQGIDLQLEDLIYQIQKPPVTKIGILDIESFYPAKDRFELAMSLNNLLAAPGFTHWLQGAPMDIGNFLYTQQGKPRIAIFSIAHLGDAERMFFVAMLLNQILGWMRSQSGTNSLRALVYMDEIFGYLPPTANPPSKTPMLTLLKQARAFGVGMVLATQNPVDLDYKALSNAGTWFIGRLQTDRDKKRVLDGLEGAAVSGGGFNRSEMEQTLAGLGKRVFLMNNVHEKAPSIFHTRWVLSYLRGPLARKQIKQLMSGRSVEAAPAKKRSAAAAKKSAASSAAQAPLLPADIPQQFIAYRGSARGEESLVYLPELMAETEITYEDRRRKINATVANSWFCDIPEGKHLDWQDLESLPADSLGIERKAETGAGFGEAPQAAYQAKNYKSWQTSLKDLIYRNASLEVLHYAPLKMFAKAEESRREFAMRVKDAAHEQRDEEIEKLRKKYDTKIGRLEERIRKAQQRLQREAAQADAKKYDTLLSFGTTLLGAVLGRKAVSATTMRRASHGARGVGQMMKERQDVARVEEDIRALNDQMRELEDELKQEIELIHDQYDDLAEKIETFPVRPKKTNIAIQTLGIAWRPHWRASDGTLRDAAE